MPLLARIDEDILWTRVSDDQGKVDLDLWITTLGCVGDPAKQWLEDLVCFRDTNSTDTLTIASLS